jgi:hypothetical protein
MMDVGIDGMHPQSAERAPLPRREVQEGTPTHRLLTMPLHAVLGRQGLDRVMGMRWYSQ